MKDLIETWEINNRINLYLLDSIDEKNLAEVFAPKSRSVGNQFAHLHSVRMMWLKAAAPDLLKGLTKLDKEVTLTKKLLSAELKKSSDAITSLLKKGFEEGKIKGFKPHPSAFLGYLIALDAHHRGQIMLCLKQSGHPVAQKTQYGLWEWGSR